MAAVLTATCFRRGCGPGVMTEWTNLPFQCIMWPKDYGHSPLGNSWVHRSYLGKAPRCCYWGEVRRQMATAVRALELWLSQLLWCPSPVWYPLVHMDSGSQHRAEPLIYHMQGGSRDAKETISWSPQRACILAGSRQCVSWEGHQNGQNHASSLDLELAIPSL